MNSRDVVLFDRTPVPGPRVPWTPRAGRDGIVPGPPALIPLPPALTTRTHP